MSWSVGAVGRPTAVAAKLAADFSQHPCIDPEEGIRQTAAHAIAVALAAQDPSVVVNVQASGHQSQNYDSKGSKTTFSNTLNITITPLYDFVE